MLNTLIALLALPQDALNTPVPSPESEAWAVLGNAFVGYLPHLLMGVAGIFLWRKYVVPIGKGAIVAGRGIKSMAPITTAALVGTAAPPVIETIHNQMGLAGSGTAAAWIGPGLLLAYCLTTQFRVWNRVPEKPALRAVMDKLDSALTGCDTDSSAHARCMEAREALNKYV